MTQCVCGGNGYVITGWAISDGAEVPIIKECPVCGPIFAANIAGDLDLVADITDAALRACSEKQEELVAA